MPPRPRSPSSPFPCLIATLVASSLTACGGDAGSEASLRVETVGGIEHTVAADHPERGDERLEFLWRAPDEAAVRDGSEWANPTNIALNENYIAVLDPQLSRVHLFTSDGERAGSFGQSGEGPGELARPMSLAVHGDSIMVAETLRVPSLQWFDREGRYIGGTIESDPGSGAGAIFLPETGILRPIAVSEAGQVWEYMSLAGESWPFELPGNHPMQPHVADGGDGCWRRGAAGPHLVEVDCAFPLVRVIDVHGQVVREHRIEREPVRTPDELIEEAILRIEEGMQASAAGAPPDLVNQIIQRQLESIRTNFVWTPFMRSALGSSSGHRIILVEQLPENLAPQPATLHILDAEGRYLARHAFDHRLGAVAASDTQLVVMVEDPETGLRHMEAYRLP